MSNKEVYFEDVVNLGTLFIEHVFLEFEYEPIFFTCSDNNNNLYICLCSEIRGEQRWIVSKTSIENIQMMLEQKMDMASALNNSSRIVKIVRDRNGTESSEELSIDDIDELDLPERGTMLRCNSSHAMNYLLNKSFEKLSLTLGNMTSNYVNEMLEKCASKLDNILQGLSDNIEEYTSYILNDKENQFFEYRSTETQYYLDKEEHKDIKQIDDKYFMAA